MPILTPVLDDRNFEQLLQEAKARISSFTPEWTNYAGESDPGITIVELFAFLTENLLYRSNRVPELNRLKFLQLMGVALAPASPAEGIISIQSDRGPLQPHLVDRGTVVSAGSVDFVMQDPVDVLPIESAPYYKRPITKTDPNFDTYLARYEAVRVAAEAAAEAERSGGGQTSASASTTLAFYETAALPPPTPAAPDRAAIDLNQDVTGGALYLALLAPPNVLPELVRPVIANHTLSICVVPPQDGGVQPLMPAVTTAPVAGLIYEIANVAANPSAAQWSRLRTYASPDVLNAAGVVQLQLPGVEDLATWTFPDPMQEGTGDFPPKLDDEGVRARLITWVRIRRAPESAVTNTSPSPAGAFQPVQASTALRARITWVGANSARVYQAVPVFNEIAGTASGEPDQSFNLSNGNIIAASMKLVTQDVATPATTTEQWRQVPLQDLLQARQTDRVFALDPESGQIRFGDGLRGSRPEAGRRIVASYEYGGGSQGNVGIGAIKSSKDQSLQGGFKISNPLPTSGGSAAQTAAQGERSIPLKLRNTDRLVTAADFHDIALETPGAGVGRVEVLPLFLPGAPDRPDAAGVVTLMVVPQSDGLDPLWPTPDRAFLQRVCSYLEPRRLVTTEIHVKAPQYVSVYISVGVTVRAGFFPDIVRKNVENGLRVYLSALPPGGPFGGGWPLSRRLLKKDLEAVATRVPGVDYVESMELGIEGPVDVDEYLLNGLQLPRVAGITVGEGPAEPLNSVFGSKPPPASGDVLPIPVGPVKC